MGLACPIPKPYHAHLPPRTCLPTAGVVAVDKPRADEHEDKAADKDQIVCAPWLADAPDASSERTHRVELRPTQFPGAVERAGLLSLEGHVWICLASRLSSFLPKCRSSCP